MPTHSYSYTALTLLSAFVSSLSLSTPAAPAQQVRLTDVSDSFEQLAVRVSPAVVQIFASGYSAGSGLVAPSDLVPEQRSRGSGVLLTDNGYIVTNAHVVSGARRIRVLLPPRMNEERTGSVLGRPGALIGAQLVGMDVETDLAVLKIPGDNLPHLTLGDSESVHPGQIVLAFGSPLGLENSVTMGVVSAVARQLSPEDPMIYIQTDASINPGNSGGPLVDSDGNVIGINTMIFSRSGGDQGLGFAAPSNIVQTVFDQIRASGRVNRGEIGVNAQTITTMMAKGLSLERAWGVILSDVKPRGPAAEAGLLPGDIVLTLDGKVMENGRQLAVNVYQKRVGDKVRLEVLRGETTHDFVVDVVERADHPDRFANMVRPDDNLVEQLGILGLDLEPSLARRFNGLRRERGVVVAARALNQTPWQGTGLAPGDVIYAVNGLDVASLSELKAALARYYPGEPIVVLVERRRVLTYVTLEID